MKNQSVKVYKTSRFRSKIKVLEVQEKNQGVNQKLLSHLGITINPSFEE